MYPSQELDRFQVRLPAGLRDKIRELAKANHRSMNAEIVKLIEDRLEVLESYGRIREHTGSVNDEEISRLMRRLHGGVGGDLTAEVADVLAKTLAVAPE